MTKTRMRFIEKEKRRVLVFSFWNDVYIEWMQTLAVLKKNSLAAPAQVVPT